MTVVCWSEATRCFDLQGFSYNGVGACAGARGFRFQLCPQLKFLSERTLVPNFQFLKGGEKSVCMMATRTWYLDTVFMAQ